MNSTTLLRCAGLLILSGTALRAGPFPANVNNDAYSGGNVNGIPTANYNNDGIPDQYDAVNQLLGTGFVANWQLDNRLVDWPNEVDQVWNLPGGVGLVTLIGLTAGNANTLGYYTDLGVGNAKTASLGPVSGFGFAGPAYPAAQINAGGNFGFYLNTVGSGANLNWYSEPNLNVDPNTSAKWDHMMTFALPELAGTTIDTSLGQITLNNPYLVAWEDLGWNGAALGDEDYDDMMYLIDAKPIPDGGSTVMLLSGVLCLIGVISCRIRRQQG